MSLCDRAATKNPQHCAKDLIQGASTIPLLHGCSSPIGKKTKNLNLNRRTPPEIQCCHRRSLERSASG
jgi:hypothetical protein